MTILQHLIIAITWQIAKLDIVFYSTIVVKSLGMQWLKAIALFLEYHAQFQIHYFAVFQLAAQLSSTEKHLHRMQVEVLDVLI